MIPEIQHLTEEEKEILFNQLSKSIKPTVNTIDYIYSEGAKVHLSNREAEVNLVTLDLENKEILVYDKKAYKMTWVNGLDVDIVNLEYEENWLQDFYQALKNLYGGNGTKFVNYFKAWQKSFEEIIKLELLIKGGIKFNSVYSLTIDFNRKKLYQKLGLSKRLMEVVVERNIAIDSIAKSQHNMGDWYSFWEELFIQSEEDYIFNSTQFVNMFKDYLSYFDHKRLIEYLLYDLPRQGSTYSECWREYRDYCNMCIDMGLKDWDKYPSFLKTKHDIVRKNYRYKQDQIKEKKLIEVYSTKSELLFSDKNYKITLPQSIQDIIYEGSALSHCVASYIDRVIEGNTLIVFMRKVYEEETPLITIEIKDGVIVHTKGFSNREPNRSERQFITKFAKAKELRVA